MIPTSPSIRLFGIGNPFRSDDAVGRLVAQQLQALTSPSIGIYESDGDGAKLIDEWQGAETVYLVDAVSSSQSPGTLHRYEAHEQPLPQAIFGRSTHHWGMADAIEMARVLRKLPPRIVVYGIEAANFAYGLELSPAVQAALPELLKRLRDELSP
ncbi:MAG: hydrogenase maturation protease [Myxococcales bacterium]|nr:hydrogenase maturation protease [Myxococcales bacterium]